VDVEVEVGVGTPVVTTGALVVGLTEFCALIALDKPLSSVLVTNGAVAMIATKDAKTMICEYISNIFLYLKQI